MVMFSGIEAATMAPTENLTMENNKGNLREMWMQNKT
jgi:hypothetical protein